MPALFLIGLPLALIFLAPTDFEFFLCPLAPPSCFYSPFSISLSLLKTRMVTWFPTVVGLAELVYY